MLPRHTLMVIVMNSRELFRLLQINGGTFPTGGFSQSWGLETYVAEGTVHDLGTFTVFLENFLESSVGECEGPIVRRAWELAGEDTGSTNSGITELEELSLAVKVTGESRSASIRMGKAFKRVIEPALGDNDRERLQSIAGKDVVTYPVLYGIVCRILEIEIREAIAAYIFSTVNTLTQSATKLIPLGNVEAQKAVFEMDGCMDRVLDRCMCVQIDEITNFCPGLDIAGLRHENLPVRLYMS